MTAAGGKKAGRPPEHRRQPAAGTRTVGTGADAVAAGRWLLAACLGIALATLAAYHPAWHGGMVWDDAAHVTRPALRSLDGLRRIWFEPGTTAQYYPVVHSAFWVLHRLWGDSTTGYHLLNILLHVASSCLVLLVLRTLKVPGAALAAVLFALHPVQVESVAWISELKNCLSGALVLSSALAYMHFDRDRRWKVYVVAAALFCLALLAKSVTATLPAVILVAFWWQRGRLDWRRDVVPLLPFFAAGAVSGLFTAWVERTDIGATGAEFAFTFVERGLIAGRALWFYLATLAWPVHLSFVYPRWAISQADPSQFLYPAAALALAAALWAIRSRTRGPLAALLAFAGILFPALGFFNVYPFRFSFVADHFQYLACIPVFALASAAVATGLERWRPGLALQATGLLLVGAGLGGLTWSHSHEFSDALTLYRTTIARNPDAWMAHGNLGAMLRRTSPDEAIGHLAEAVRLKPDLVEGHYNLAAALQEAGRLDEAAAQYRKTIELLPGHARAFCNLANVLRQRGRLEDAERSAREAIRLEPGLALAHRNLGDVLQEQGRADLALAEYSEAARLTPADPQLLADLGVSLRDAGQLEPAVARFEEAARRDPRSGAALVGLCATLPMVGRLDEAAAACDAAVTTEPRLAPARYHRANLLQRQKRLAESLAEYEAALRLQSDAPDVHCAIALALEGLGRKADASRHLDEALRLAPDELTAHMSMASAMEAVGRFGEARAEFKQTLRLAPQYTPAHLALARIDAQEARIRTEHR